MSARLLLVTLLALYTVVCQAATFSNEDYSYVKMENDRNDISEDGSWLLPSYRMLKRGGKSSKSKSRSRKRKGGSFSFGGTGCTGDDCETDWENIGYGLIVLVVTLCTCVCCAVCCECMVKGFNSLKYRKNPIHIPAKTESELKEISRKQAEWFNE